MLCLLRFNSYCQSDTTIISIHKVVGDTLDAAENQRFGLFKESFDYAIYADINNKCKVLMHFPNDSMKVTDYSFDAAIVDGMNVSDVLESGDAITYVSEHSGEKAKLRIVTKEKTKRLRKGRRIVLEFKSDEYNIFKERFNQDNLVRTRLLAIHGGEEPSILVKIRKKGKPKVEIPLSNIKSIRNYTEKEHQGALASSVVNLAFFPFTTIASFFVPYAIPLAIINGYSGFKPIFRGNRVYHLGSNAELEIYY